MKKKYLRCKAVYEWEVVVDNSPRLRTRNKFEADIVLDHYLREKVYDNVYLKKITSVRYTLVEE